MSNSIEMMKKKTNNSKVRARQIVTTNKQVVFFSKQKKTDGTNRQNVNQKLAKYREKINNV